MTHGLWVQVVARYGCGSHFSDPQVTHATAYLVALAQILTLLLYSFVDHNMFMQFYGGNVRHQHGNLGHPQLPPVAPEPITRLSGQGYDDKIDKNPVDNPIPQESEKCEHPIGSDNEEADPDSNNKKPMEEGDEDNEDNEDKQHESNDEEGLKPEDGEAKMGEDKHKLAAVGFMP